MKSYDTSVLFKYGDNWLLPIPIHLCANIKLKDHNFYSNLFWHQEADPGNQYEVIYSPFKQKDFNVLFNIKMRLKSGTGSTHEMLSLVKNPEVFYMDVLVISGIDTSTPDSGEVEVIGKVRPCPISGKSNLSAAVFDNDLKKINEEIKKRSETSKLLREYSPNEYLKCEKCFDRHYLHDPQPIERAWRNKEVVQFADTALKGIPGFNIFVIENNLMNEFIEIIKKQFNTGLIKEKLLTEYDQSLFVSLRLDGERNALSVILKSSKERVYRMNLNLKPEADIVNITQILSILSKVDFRSINSVNTYDRNVIVTIAANFTNSKFDNLHPAMIQQYLFIKNDQLVAQGKPEHIDFSDPHKIVNTVYKFNDVCFPSEKDDLDKFLITLFALIPNLDNPIIPSPLQNTISSVTEYVKWVRDICVIVHDASHNQLINDIEKLKAAVTSYLEKNSIKMSWKSIEPKYPYCLKLTDSSNNSVHIIVRNKCALLIKYSGSLATKSHEAISTSNWLKTLKSAFRGVDWKRQEKINTLYQEAVLNAVENTVYSNLPIYEERYVCVEDIKKGGNYGVVFRGVDEKNNDQEIAIKIMDQNPSNVESIIAGTSFSHINLVPYHHYFGIPGPDSTKWVIIMDWLEGTTVKDYLKSHEKPSIEEALIFFKQILDGIKYLHDYQVSSYNWHLGHFDIKPANIQILKDLSKIIILDYGLSGFLDYGDIDLTVKNRDEKFVCPEIYFGTVNQIKGSRAFVDIFSLGVLLSYLLFGRHPYNRYAEIMNDKDLCHNSELLGDIQSNLGDDPIKEAYISIITKACDIDYSKRFQSVQEFQNAFTGVQQQNGLVENMESTLERNSITENARSQETVNPEPPVDDIKNISANIVDSSKTSP